MHELSVCRSMLGQVADIARRHGADQVARIRVQIGPLSGVEPKLLSQVFPVASVGTIAEGAELVLESLPVLVRCHSCGADSEARINRLVCGSCGDWQTQLLSGDELLLASIEVIRTGTGSPPELH